MTIWRSQTHNYCNKWLKLIKLHAQLAKKYKLIYTLRDTRATTSHFPVEPRLAARSGTARGELVTYSSYSVHRRCPRKLTNGDQQRLHRIANDGASFDDGSDSMRSDGGGDGGGGGGVRK